MQPSWNTKSEYHSVCPFASECTGCHSVNASLRRDADYLSREYTRKHRVTALIHCPSLVIPKCLRDPLSMYRSCNRCSVPESFCSLHSIRIFHHWNTTSPFWRTCENITTRSNKTNAFKQMSV